jgi:hypothetical protein
LGLLLADLRNLYAGVFLVSLFGVWGVIVIVIVMMALVGDLWLIFG